MRQVNKPVHHNRTRLVFYMTRKQMPCKIKCIFGLDYWQCHNFHCHKIQEIHCDKVCSWKSKYASNETVHKNWRFDRCNQSSILSVKTHRFNRMRTRAALPIYSAHWCGLSSAYTCQIISQPTKFTYLSTHLHLCCTFTLNQLQIRTFSNSLNTCTYIFLCLKTYKIRYHNMT